MANPNLVRRRLAAAIRKGSDAQAKAVDFRKGRVSAVNAGDHTVDINIVVDGKGTEATLPHVACLKAYTSRTVNDAVWFVTFGRAKYLCLGPQG